jgi:hypothetical protein
MIFNGSSKIKDDGGDYLVIVDYGCEGFSVSHQAQTHEDALRWMTASNYGSPQTLVKLVRVETRDSDTANSLLDRNDLSNSERKS